MALAGFDTPILVFSSSATNSAYGGTVTGVTAGNLYAVCLMACSDSSLNTPSSWTVTLGSDTMTYRSGQSSNGVFGFTAWFTVVATGSGDLSLSVTTSNNCRSMAGYAFDITGFDTTTPIPNAGQADSHSSNTTTLTAPNGVTTAADGNAILGCVSIRGGDITGLAVGAADGSTTGQTGGNATSDNEWGIAWDRTPTAASVTFAWSWTGADRPGAAWIEVAEATASGTDVPASSAALSLTANQASIANDVSVTGAAASLAITPHAAAISTAANVDVGASPAALQISPMAASIAHDIGVSAGAASLQTTGHAASISHDVGVSASPATLQLAVHSAAVSVDRQVSAEPATLQITPNNATISTQADTLVDVAPADMRITGRQASISLDAGVPASTTVLQITPNAATVSLGVGIQATPANLQVAPNAATISLGRNISAEPSDLNLMPLRAGIAHDINVTVAIAALQLAMPGASIFIGGVSSRRHASPANSASGGTLADSETGGTIGTSFNTGTIGRG